MVNGQTSSAQIDRPQQAAARPAIRLTLLGGFDVEVDGETLELSRATQRLVAFLALRSRPQPRRHVAGSLWPDTSDERAAANLRSALWRLRSRGRVIVRAIQSQLELSPTVDVDVRRSIATASALNDDDPSISWPDRDPPVLSEDLLPDWSDTWVMIEREHFRQLRLHALESLCLRLARAGRYVKAVEAGLAAVQAEPLRESAHRALVSAHLAEGNLGEAANQYRLFRRLLNEELGLEPSEAMERLIAPIRAPGRPLVDRIPLRLHGWVSAPT